MHCALRSRLTYSRKKICNPDHECDFTDSYYPRKAHNIIHLQDKYTYFKLIGNAKGVWESNAYSFQCCNLNRTHITKDPIEVESEIKQGDITSGDLNQVYRFFDGVVKHGTSEHFPCPYPESKGTFKVSCQNGVPTISDFTCKKHCLAQDNVENTYRHPYFHHGSMGAGYCLTDNSSVTLGCEDGNTGIVVGECGVPCLADDIKLTQVDAAQPFSTFYHQQRQMLNCTGQSFGTATLVCLDGTTTIDEFNCGSWYECM